MKLSRFAYRMVGFTLLAFGVVNSANAGTELCKKPFPKCGSTCGRAPSSGSIGASCRVRVSQTSGEKPVATVGKEDFICVDPGTDISWFTKEKGSTLTVKFNEHPFTHSQGSPATFQGNELSTHIGDTTMLPPVNSPPACYEYSVTHSIGGSNASLDPKVIVNGVRGHHKPDQASEDPVEK
jgi:hypothetical protein